MRSIGAETVLDHMTPSTLVDYMLNLTDTPLAFELYDMAYNALVRCVGTKEADAMLAETEGMRKP